MRISDGSSDVCSSDLLPLVFDKIIRHRREHVRQRFKQIALAIAITVAGEMAIAGRHELAPAHGTGIAALHGLQVERFFLRQCKTLRSEERRVGKEGVSTCRSRWSKDH